MSVVWTVRVWINVTQMEELVVGTRRLLLQLVLHAVSTILLVVQRSLV
jgi:hypothetical protein